MLAFCWRQRTLSFLIIYSIASILNSATASTAVTNGDSKNNVVAADSKTQTLHSGNTKFAEHPMLFYSAGAIPVMREKAKTSHLKYAAKLREARQGIMSNKKWFPPSTYEKFADHWNELYGNLLPPMALCSVLFPEDSEAFDYLVAFMDQMVEYKNWRVLANLEDEVPLGHHVTGFATALDMIYTRLNKGRRLKYVRKLTEMTKDLYESGQHRGWGRTQHLQNHVATNVIAIFIGSLVLSSHTIEAVVWRKYSVEHWEKSMEILRHIPDGSLDEGVGYVGYTFRSMCQYIYLAERHLGINHYNNPWLPRHFEYYFYTTVPGFQASVGIADTPRGWFYGPEAFLIFLDSFVLKDGRGNWLANQIEKNRHNINGKRRPPDQIYTTLHLEFLFYNPQVGERPPEKHEMPELHHFTDWGVVTYRSGPISDPKQTYLSFKSSKIHGETVYNMVKTKSKYAEKGWKNFNAGHEHPDQNSFTFWPNGEMFISDGLYADKLPYLDNVLMFAPSTGSECTAPWAGQIGACGKWLDYRQKVNYGEIKQAYTKDEYVFMSGEAVHAYSSSLLLKSVYRAVILLEKDMLVVVDYIEKETDSPLTHASAFFQNNNYTLRPRAYPRGRFGFGVQLDSGLYEAVWATRNGQSNPVTVLEVPHKFSHSSIANLTYQLEGPSTTVAYIFHGPHSSVDSFTFSEGTPLNSTLLLIETKHKSYSLKLDANGFHFRSQHTLALTKNRPSRESVVIRMERHEQSTGAPVFPYRTEWIFLTLVCLLLLVPVYRRFKQSKKTIIPLMLCACFLYYTLTWVLTTRYSN